MWADLKTRAAGEVMSSLEESGWVSLTGIVSGKELAFHKKTLKSGLRTAFTGRGVSVSSTRGSFRGRGWALRKTGPLRN